MIDQKPDRFDYTEWRRLGLPEMELDTLAAAANELAREITTGNN